MEPRMAELARRFAFNTLFARRLGEGMEDQDWRRAPVEAGGNCAHWVLGHVAATRRGLLRATGEALPKEHWEEHFQRGGSPTDTASYPAVATLFEELDRCGRLMSERLGALRQEDVDKSQPHVLPDGGSTVGDLLSFLLFHETYHLGQLGLLRRQLGKPGLA